MPKRTDMTDRIYAYLQTVIPEQGYAPSVREICQAVGLKSPSTVHFHLKRLQERGLIEKGDFKGRAIVLTQQAEKNRIPILGHVAAGTPILAQECVEDYLTFDCGYENGNTAPILDALKKHKAPAAFFVVGNFISTSPDLVKRMHEEGHIIGNHTYHHPDMSQISTKEAFAKELGDVEDLYQEITGETMTKYYRPPQGKYSIDNLQMAKDMGYHTFFWSLAYVDWYQDDQPSHEEAFDKLLGRIHPGAVVLLHSTSSTNAEILDELLGKWEDMGYTFHSLDELTKKEQHDSDK